MVPVIPLMHAETSHVLGAMAELGGLQLRDGSNNMIRVDEALKSWQLACCSGSDTAKEN